MTQQTNGTPELKYSEEAFRAMYEALKKVRDWLFGLMRNAEIKSKDGRFVTLQEAYKADAQNYRAIITDINKALFQAEEVHK